MNEKTVAFPRVMIAAPYGRCGKTVIVSSIMRALKNRGIAVQPFKKGPDYIDPGWHTLASGKASRSLDSFFMSPETMRSVMAETANDARIGIIEGAMGLFDGSDLEGSTSSAEVAKRTNTPVILVVDVTRMTRTTAAVVMGCQHFDEELNIVGVILNRVRGKRHEKRIREAIEHFCKIEVIGAVPDDELLRLPDRHLGLVTACETQTASTFLDGAASVIEKNVDIDRILEIADCAAPLEAQPISYPRAKSMAQPGARPVTIAVVRDSSFSFYYQENLNALEAAGARLTYIDSLTDDGVPDDADGLYIGGGFPEIFAQSLQNNKKFRESVRKRIDEGIACCAECGGLMYLGRTLKMGERSYEMTGALEYDVTMMAERQGHGYSVAVATADHPWLAEGTVINGHEHHHSKVICADEELGVSYENRRGSGLGDKHDGYCKGRTIASYLHVNAIASPQWATSFVDAAVEYRDSRESRNLQPGSRNSQVLLRMDASVHQMQAIRTIRRRSEKLVAKVG